MKQNIAKKCFNPNAHYSNRTINNLLAFLFILSVPLSYAHLRLVSRNSNFYVNVITSDLTEFLAKALGGAYRPNRYNKILGKFYLFPLRAYSHMVRQEWIFESSPIKSVLKILTEDYIRFFVKAMKGKRFFVREDYFGEASLICSISQSIGCFNTISYQHGSMDLKRIRREGIYPGQRANMQISHDRATYNVFKMNNPFRSKIVFSKPCYRFVNQMHVNHDEIYMIGNSSPAAFRELDNIASSIKKCFKLMKIYYKPHPSEKTIESINMEKCGFRDGSLLTGPVKRIFIGHTSTLLYDAYMSGHLVYCLDQDRFPCFDSLAMLGSIPVITPHNACQLVSIIKDNVFLKSRFTPYNEALNYEDVAQTILDAMPL